jgi:hypothetical protein
MCEPPGRARRSTSGEGTANIVTGTLDAKCQNQKSQTTGYALLTREKSGVDDLFQLHNSAGGNRT